MKSYRKLDDGRQLTLGFHAASCAVQNIARHRKAPKFPELHQRLLFEDSELMHERKFNVPQRAKGRDGKSMPTRCKRKQADPPPFDFEPYGMDDGFSMDPTRYSPRNGNYDY